MRYANLIPASHIARSADPRLTADARRAVITAKAVVVSATESAKRFARTAPLVNRDGTFDHSAICAAIRRLEVTSDVIRGWLADPSTAPGAKQAEA